MSMVLARLYMYIGDIFIGVAQGSAFMRMY